MEAVDKLKWVDMKGVEGTMMVDKLMSDREMEQCMPCQEVGKNVLEGKELQRVAVGRKQQVPEVAQHRKGHGELLQADREVLMEHGLRLISAMIQTH